MPASGRFRPRHSRRATAFARGIWNPSFNRSSTGILRGVRGPHGGYTLTRERHRIGVEEIVRAAETVNDPDKAAVSSAPIADVVSSAIAEAERAFSKALSQINVDDLARKAEASTHSVHTSIQETERREPRP